MRWNKKQESSLFFFIFIIFTKIKSIDKLSFRKWPEMSLTCNIQFRNLSSVNLTPFRNVLGELIIKDLLKCENYENTLCGSKHNKNAHGSWRIENEPGFPI